jgi:pimeloyl-ACP methyl ester carboxylesterase
VNRARTRVRSASGSGPQTHAWGGRSRYPEPVTPTPSLSPALRAFGAPLTWLLLKPVRVPALVTPRARGLNYRAFRLQSRGARLAAWHVPCPGSRKAIVLCHGHNNARTQLLPLLRPLHEAGFHLLLFDFRCQGLSTGDACTYGLEEYRDVLAAVEWLRTEIGVEQVGLFGISMGGASVLLAASQDPRIAAVATDCAFARLEDMLEQRFYILPRPARAPLANAVRYWVDRWVGDAIGKVDPEAEVRHWRPRPLLLIHGAKDRLTPSAHAHRLARAAGEEAELWVVPRAGHCASRRVAGPEYARRVTEFFSRSVR